MVAKFPGGKRQAVINNIKLCLNHGWKIKGRKIKKFSPDYNVLIGPNGSGKSTLLKSIQNCPDCKRNENGKTEYRLFDSETMNPHVSKEHLTGYTGMVIKTRSNFSSHGEIMRAALSAFEFTPGDCVLIDEPESGQDLQWVVKIRKGLDSICKLGCQVIVASHHPAFWVNAHTIELKYGYTQKTINWLKTLTIK